MDQQSQEFFEDGAIAIFAEMLLPGPLKLEPGRQLGHYSVLSFLGAGGMGEVYLAEDMRLGRHVALKILPEQLLLTHSEYVALNMRLVQLLHSIIQTSLPSTRLAKRMACNTSRLST